MYFKRKVDSYLRQWKEKENRLPLIIKGARQIGKTESIIHFADENYENVVSINFVLEGQYKTILSDGYSVENIIKNISLIDPSKKFIAGKTLIVFDELQEFPDISTSLKSFKMDGRFDVICSGSLLGINYKKIHSNSVKCSLWILRNFSGQKATQIYTSNKFWNICVLGRYSLKRNCLFIKNCFLNIACLGGCPQLSGNI